jgi:hypothetical protein
MDSVQQPAVVIERAADEAPHVDGSSDRAPDLPHREVRPVEIGAGTFMVSGVGQSGVLGLSSFVTDGLGRGTFLRLAFGIAESQASTPRTTWAAGRIDICSGIPGNYADGSGLRLDLCGGADVGLTHIAPREGADAPAPSQTFPYVDVGPSAALRAELGFYAAFSLRASVGISVARDSFVDSNGNLVQPPPGSASLELDFSWRLR